MGLAGNGHVAAAGQEGKTTRYPDGRDDAPHVPPAMKEFWRMAQDTEKPESLDSSDFRAFFKGWWKVSGG